MPRAATGQVIRRQSGAWALRFRAYGQRRYLTLGTAADGWSHTTASIELQNTLADVRRGIWSPVKPQPKRLPDNDPSFRDFATNWLRMSQPEWEPKTVSDYEWQLVHHLLPFFGDHRLSDITIAEVDRYKQTKASEARTLQAAIAEGNVLVTKYVDKNGQKRTRRARPLSPTSINKTIGRLSQILGVAVEYGLIQSNSAKGRRRRVKARPIRPVWLDSAEHIEALLDAAGELDHPAELKRGHEQRGGLVYRRALLATLIFAGPRIGELTALNWRDIDLTAGQIRVREAKTAAGVRQIDLLPTLRDVLSAHKARVPNESPEAFVFPSTRDTQMSQESIRDRVLRPAVANANVQLLRAGNPPLPDGLTPHKLRHTFASILIAVGVDPGSVMDQLGHSDPGFTLRLYRHSMRRDADARASLLALVGIKQVRQAEAR